MHRCRYRVVGALACDAFTFHLQRSSRGRTLGSSRGRGLTLHLVFASNLDGVGAIVVIDDPRSASIASCPNRPPSQLARRITTCHINGSQLRMSWNGVCVMHWACVFGQFNMSTWVRACTIHMRLQTPRLHRLSPAQPVPVRGVLP